MDSVKRVRRRLLFPIDSLQASYSNQALILKA
jgi:hypothetical protein